MKILSLLLVFSICVFARNSSEKLYSVRAYATNQQERTKISEAGIAIDAVFSDSIMFIGTEKDIEKATRTGIKLDVEEMSSRAFDFPTGDQAFHNYTEVLSTLDGLAAKFPKIVSRIEAGKSLEGRRLTGVRISSQIKPDSLPTVIFVGCHHAREHLSVEVPLKIAEYLANNYDKDSRVKALIDTREIYIVPMLNPDGAEYDIASGNYKYWRKNRKDNGDGTFGVDLNRNYGPSDFFGGPGSSSDTDSDTYHGTAAFSEPETAALRDFIRARKKATVLLSFHTFSELILWPYGHSNDPIANSADRKVFEMMGNEMSKWNNYTPEKSSELYLASGDTTDWAYQELKLFAFTFELSPSSMFGGGFYPGASAIEPTFKANLEPALYLIEKAGNPYSVLKEKVETDPLGIL